jgi:hypothetical protein
MTIQQELENYWHQNGLPQNGGADDLFNEAKIGKFSFKYPNLDGKALILHDLNHLITGYETNWEGECQVSAWELASGGRIGYPRTWIYPISLVFLGIIICPLKTLKAFKNGRNCLNTFVLSLKYDIFNLSKKELISLSFSNKINNGN